MCKCTPEIRTPWCGKRGCEEPEQRAESIEQIVGQLFDRVRFHMGWDKEKTILWFRTVNPLLGNLTPDDMILRGRAKKLEKFIDSCVREDEPIGFKNG